MTTYVLLVAGLGIQYSDVQCYANCHSTTERVPLIIIETLSNTTIKVLI